MSKESDNPTDLLVDRIKQGVRLHESWKRLVELHRPRVRAFFVRKGFPPEEREDLTQEVFLRVFKGIDAFRQESTFEWWMFEIADSVYKNTLRWKGAEKRYGIEQSLDGPMPGGDATSQGIILATSDPTPEEDLIRTEQLARIRAAFGEMPPQMRLCCTLRYERGLKYQEIATLMNISIETVKAHLHQARKRLISMLADGGSEVP